MPGRSPPLAHVVSAAVGPPAAMVAMMASCCLLIALAPAAVLARPELSLHKPPMPEEPVLNTTGMPVVSDVVSADSFNGGVVPFYAKPSEDSCTICNYILDRSAVSEVLTPDAGLDLAKEVCDGIDRGITRWQCQGIAKVYLDDLVNGHCNTACEGAQRKRRAACQSHSECLTTQFCGQNQECQACSVCATKGVDVALGGYCPCLGGTIEGITPAEGTTVTGGTLQKVVFKTENVGPAVHIEIYERSDNTEPFRTIQQFVRVSETGQTEFQWPVSRFYPSGQYYLSITSISNSQIVGLVPSTGYFQLEKSYSCQVHEVCSSSTYCDIYNSCYMCSECERWNDAIDGQCPKKCFETVSTRAQVTFQLPKASTKVATNSFLPIVWSYNNLVLDFIDLYLLPVNSFNAHVSLAVRQTVSSGSIAWEVPRTFTPGYYWIAATHTADETLQVIGSTPEHLSKIGDTGFEIFSLGCPTHDSCEDTEYCSSDGSCYSCDECFRQGDAYDDKCPEKCGGGSVMEFGTTRPDGPEADASGTILEFILPGCPEYKELQHMTATETIKFAGPTSDGDPTRVSSRLRRHITTLGSVIHSVFGDTAYLKVLQAYLEPPADITRASLHNVGRAALLTVEGVPSDFASDVLGTLGGLAAEAGFDYVAYNNQHYIYVSVIADACQQDLDLVFLLDGSGSIESTALGGAPNTFEDRVLQFVSQVTTYFTVAEDRTRVAVATFATGATVNIRLNDHFDGDELREAIAEIPYPRGLTSTSLGLRAVRQDILTEENGMRPLSAGVPRVLVVLTDGNSQASYDPAAEASILHDQNVNVFAIGVGSSIAQSQLQDIASDPDSSYIFNLRSFSVIGDIVDAMSVTTCEAPAVLTAGESVISSVRPCETLFFRPLCGQVTNLNIELKSSRGAAIMFVARNTSHPSPFDHDHALTSTDEVKTLQITRDAADTAPVYIAIQANHQVLTASADTGLLPHVDFALTVYSDIFPGVGETQVQVLESKSLGSVIFTPPAVTLADPQPVFEFQLVGRDDEQFSVDARTGAVRLARPLDRERVSSYTLRIAARAVTLPCLTGAVDVTVQVQDVNDNAPVFNEQAYSVLVQEGQPRGLVILRVAATDADVGANAEIVYSLGTRGVPFAIDGQTGVIVTTDVLNDDVADSYTLKVVASDGMLSSTAVVSVTVVAVPCSLGEASETGTLPCTKCGNGTYQDGSQTTATRCLPCGCGEGEYATGRCTPERNYDCKSCPAFSSSEAGSTQLSDCGCNDGFYKVEKDDGSFVCARCTQECSPGSYESAACTRTEDTACTPCRSMCPAGHFLSGKCNGTSNYDCTPCTRCEAGSYISSPCQLTGDRECTPCTTYDDCEAGVEYIDGVCATGTDTSSPACRKCDTSCGPGEFLTGECGGEHGTALTSCKQCTRCLSGQYLVQDCTDTADRQCADCITSCEEGFYLVGECNPRSSVAPRCEACTTSADCGDDQFLDDRPCGGSSTPQCQDCHPTCASCDGAASDRCTACPPGANLHDGACVEDCPPGNYAVDNECKPCSSNCRTCNGTSDTCTSCDGTVSLVLHDATCVSTCPPSYFKDFVAGVCRQCRTCSGQTYKTGGCSGATNTLCTPWSAPCEAGVEYESTSPTPTNDRECTECITSCPAGEQVTGECISKDRTCEECPDGRFKESSGGQPCIGCPTSCASTEYLTGTCTATESTVCRECRTECDAGFYLSGKCNGTRTVPTCEACSKCGDDEYRVRACSSTNGGSDTVCATCTSSCPDGHYMSSACSAQADAVCTPCVTEDDCLSTEVLVGTCGGTETPRCVSCHPECLTCSGPTANNCTACKRGLFLSGSMCRAECEPGTFESTASGECEPCHDSCHDCAGASSSACTSCAAPLFLLGTECVAGCPSGYFGDEASRMCRKCRECPAGSFKVGGCSGTVDTTCQLWDACDEGEYEVVAPTAFRNRECQACRESCPAGSELTGDCGGATGTSNPMCEPCDEGFFKEDPGAGACQPCRTTCPNGSFLRGQCSTTTQPACQTCKTTCTGDRYLTGTCAGRQDYTCVACDTCEEGEYEVAPCEGTGQNRQCATCRTSCPVGQYLTGVCEGNQQPQCADCRTQQDCQEGEYVTGECGGDDGRQNPTCAACNASCARCDGPLQTACTACADGTHLQRETGRCVSNCTSGTFEDDGICSACDASCADCSGDGPSRCTACKAGTFLSGGTCVSTCPSDTFGNATSGRCQACSACPFGAFVTAACGSTSDTACQAWSACEEGTYQSTAPTGTSDRECAECTTTCPAGQELSVSCTATRNAQCTPCESGTFKPSRGPGMCQDCVDTCTDGYFLTGTCSATTAPTCQACTSTCSAGFFLHGECEGRNNPQCTACDTCGQGTYERTACSLGGNRQCAACTTPADCQAGEYLDGECTPTSNPRCRACTKVSECGADQYLKGACAADEPNPTCASCTVCAGDEYEVAPCTETSDRQCAKCTTECPNGHFLTGACPGSLAAAFPRTLVVDGVTYAALDATFPSDTSLACQEQTALPPGWSLVTNPDVAREMAAAHAWGTSCMVVSRDHAFATSNSASLSPGEACHCDEVLGCMSTSDDGLLSVTACPRRILIQWAPPSCQECTPSCPDGHFLSGECGGRSNPMCRPCTVCEEGFYETTPCTHLDVGSQDRVCERCVTEDDCDEGEYLSGACGGMSTPTCKACTTSCPDGFYLSGTCGGTSNPECKPCSTCVEGETFEVAKCSVTSDTMCEGCTLADDCDLDQFLSQPCTLSSDGVCTHCTQAVDCESGFYLDGACTRTQDAACQPCHPSCAECESAGSEGCTACDNNLSLSRIGFGHVGSCVSECPPGEAENSENNVCEPCHNTCGNCTAPAIATGCTACEGDRFLTPNGTCVGVCPDGMYGDPATNECVPCTLCDTTTSFESSACGGTDDRVCSPLTTCPPGTRVVDHSTPTSDRRCGDCADGTFQSAVNQPTCTQWTACTDEQFETHAPTSTSNRECEITTECIAGSEYETSAPTPTTNRECARLTTCKVHQWESHAATASMDRTCTNLTVCTDTEYESVAPTDTSDRECEPITLCQAFEFVKVAATRFSDEECEAIRNCTANEYETAVPTRTSNRECAMLTECDFDTQYISTTATTTSDRACSQLRVCFSHEFESREPTMTTNRECTECDVCSGTEYETDTCTATTDRVCRPLTTCTDAQFESLVPTLTSDRRCSNCSACGDNSYTVTPCEHASDTVCDGCTQCAMGFFQSSVCTMASDTVCDECSACEEGHFVSSACTQIQDTKCQRCTACDVYEFERTACSASADATCKTITNCTASQYQVLAPTPTSDRLCAGLRTCVHGEEYETAAPTATTNRLCAELTECDFSMEYESHAPNATVDRVCTRLSRCDSETQFEHTAPTQTSDRVCRDLTMCEAGQEEVTAPTSSSDRACAPCSAGTTDHNSDGSDSCVTCPAGHYVPEGSVGSCTLFVCSAGTADTDGSASTPCEACNATTSYQPQPGQEACLPVSTCPAGQEEAQAPTSLSNRVCTACRLGFTYKAQPGQDSMCADVRRCPAGEEETTAPTLSSNRVCTACAGGFFKEAEGQTTQCVPVSDCAPGFQESVAPTSSTDRQCEGCPAGMFKSTTGQASCSEHAECGGSQYQTKAPTSTSDRQCAQLTVCDEDEWEEAAPTDVSNRVCQPCGSCEEEGLTQKSACTDTSPTVCTDCTTCEQGQFIASPCTSVSQTDCQDCSSCSADTEYQTQACLSMSDTQCAQLTVCEADREYQTVAATATADRECDMLTTCNVDQYECTVPTPTSNRVCCGISQCDVGEEEQAEPSASSDRECRKCPAGTTDDDASGATACVICPAGTFVAEGSTGECSTRLCLPGTADTDQDPSTPCSACDDGVSFAAEAGLVRCAAVSDCPAGERELQPPTVSTDRVCGPCPTGTFKTDEGQEPCVNASVCAAGAQYIAQAHTATSDAMCANITACTDTQYQVAAPTTVSDRRCRNLTMCDSNEYEVKAPTATTDRQCTAVSQPCSVDEFESAAPTSTSDRQCSAYTMCGAQQYQAAAPTPNSDRVCLDWTTCTSSQFEQTEPSSVSDRVCANLTVCDLASQFEAVASTPTTDRVCEGCTVCPGGTHFEVTPCTASTDASCAMCSTCSGDTYASAQCTLSSDTVCTSCSTCTQGSTFASSPCLANQDRVCSTCTTCNATEYVHMACTTEADTHCLQYTSCGRDEFESVAPTRFSDRECSPHTVCKQNEEYEVVAPTTTTDRECDALTSCNAQQFISTPHTPTTDRECTALRQCTTAEFEVTAPTSTSNRVCQRLTVCEPETEYETVPPGDARDRVCELLTVCTPLEYESVAPTATTDRDCEEQVLPPLAPLTTFSASGGLALVADATYSGTAVQQTIALLQGVSNGEDGTGPELTASVGAAATTASLDTTRPAPSAVRFELAGDGTVYEDDPWVRAVFQLSANPGVVPRATRIQLTMAVGPENTTTTACTTDTHGLCSAALRVPADWYVPGENTPANVVFAFEEVSLQAPGAVAVQGQAEYQLALSASAVFAPESDVYVRLPSRDVRAGETIELEVRSRTAFTVAGFSALVSTSDSSRLQVDNIGLDFGAWRGSAKVETAASAGVVAFTADAKSLEAMSSSEQVLFTVTATVPPSAAIGSVGIDIVLHSLDDSKGEEIRPGDRALPARVVFVGRDGVDSSTAGSITISGAQMQSIFAVPAASLLVDTASLSGQGVVHPVEIFTMRQSGGLEALAASAVSCSSSDPAVVELTGDCHLRLREGGDLEMNTATVTLTLGTDSAITTAFDVLVLRPALPLTLEADDAQLNAITGWLDETNNCHQLYQKTRVRALTSFSDGSNTVLSNVDVSSLISLQVTNDGVATVAQPTHSSHAFAGLYVEGFQPGTVTVSAEVLGQTSSLQVEVSDTPVVATRLDVTPVVELAFSAALPTELAPTAAFAASLTVDSTFTQTGQRSKVAASVVLSDATRLELGSSEGIRLVSEDAEVVEVQGQALVIRSHVQTAEVPQVEASWTSGACAAAPIISTTVPVSLNLPTVSGLAASAQRSVLAAANSTAAAAPFMQATSTTVMLTATLTSGARIDLDETDSLDIAAPSALLVSETASGLLVTVAADAAPGTYDVMVTYESVHTNFTLTVVEVEALQVACRLHANGYTSQAEGGAVTTLAPYAGLSPTTFQSCAVEARGVLSADGGSSTLDVTADVADSAVINAGSPALSLQGSVVSVSDPESPTVGQASVEVTVNGVNAQLSLTVSATGVTVASGTLSFPPQLHGLAQETTAAPTEAIVTFSDGAAFDSVSALPEGLVEFVLEEPEPLGAAGASATLVSSATGQVQLLANSVEHLVLSLLTVAASPTVLAQTQFACNLLPREGEVDFGLNSGLALPFATAGELLSFEVRANAGALEIDTLRFDILFNATAADYITTSAGSDYVGSVNGFSAAAPQVLPAAEVEALGATHFVRVRVEPNAGISGTVHLASVTFAVNSGAAGQQLFYGGRVLGFTSTAGTAIAVGASEAAPIASPAAFISAVADAANPVNRRRRRRRDVASTACSTPPCSVCEDGASRQTGDVNADCIFTLDDVSFFLDAYLETLFDPSYFTTLRPEQQEQLDANQDGSVSVLDVDLLSRVLAKDVRFVRDATVEPVSTSNGCRLEIAVRIFGAGDVAALPENTHVFFDIESTSSNFDTLFDQSVVEVGQRVSVDKGSASLQGGLWQAAHLGGDLFGVIVRTPLETEDMHGLTIFQLTSVNVTAAGGDVNVDGLSFTWGGQRQPPFAFAGYDFELTLPGMPAFRFVRGAGYNPHATFSNAQATADCHAGTACDTNEYETTAPTATSSAQCAPITNCDAEQYETTAPTATTDRQCDPRTVCNFPLEYESSPGNATADRTCTNVTTCLADEVSLQEPTPTSDRVCRLDAPCERDMYESVPLTLTSDRVCLPVTECEDGFEETVAPTATSDRQCSLIDFCVGNPCENNATCTSSTQMLTFVCSCPFGFTGTRCEHVDGCALLGNDNPCVNGRCVSDDGGIRCQCDANSACACCDGFPIDGFGCDQQGKDPTGAFCQDASEVEDAIASKQDSSDNQATTQGSLGIIVGGVLGGLALLVLVMLAVSSLRRRHSKSQDVGDFEDNPFGTGNALTSLDNPLFAPTSQYLAGFKRAVCFAFLRYKCDLVLRGPAEEMGTVYDVLMLPRPPKRVLPALKDETNAFMGSKADTSEHKLDEVADFLALAMADLVVEEAVDAAAVDAGDGTRPYRATVPNDAAGLIPKRWAAYLDPVTGQVEEPVYEDIGRARGGEFEDEDYAADGSVSPLTVAQAERFLARRVTLRKSQMHKPHAEAAYDVGMGYEDDTYNTANMEDDEPAYDRGTDDTSPLYDHGEGEDEAYAFASNPVALGDLEDYEEEEATYDMANSGSRRASGLKRGEEPNYDNAGRLADVDDADEDHDDDAYEQANVALSDSEGDYDNTMPPGPYGSGRAMPGRRESTAEPLYDQGDEVVLGFEEPDYDFGDEGKGVSQQQADQDPTYDIGDEDGDQAGAEEPDYDMGTADDDQGLVNELFQEGEQDDDDEPTYAFSQPRNTSVRPRALRSMHGRTDRGSLDGSNI